MCIITSDLPGLKTNRLLFFFQCHVTLGWKYLIHTRPWFSFPSEVANTLDITRFAVEKMLGLMWSLVTVSNLGYGSMDAACRSALKT